MFERRVAEPCADEADLVAHERELSGAATLVLLAAAQALAQALELVCELVARRNLTGHLIFSRFFQPAHFEPASRLLRVNPWPTRFVSASWARRSLLSIRASVVVASICCSWLLPFRGGGSVECSACVVARYDNRALSGERLRLPR